MRIVILGCGRLGSSLANLLAEERNEIIIIDENEDKFINLEKDVAFRIGSNIFNDNIMNEIFSEKVDVFVSATGKDTINIMAAQIVKKRFNPKKIIVRIYNPSLARVYKDMGLETVCPTELTLNFIIDMLK
jgi:trk system potassium uptake protein TrkA